MISISIVKISHGCRAPEVVFSSIVSLEDQKDKDNIQVDDYDEKYLHSISEETASYYLPPAVVMQVLETLSPLSKYLIFWD